jgi:hypothetical protein
MMLSTSILKISTGLAIAKIIRRANTREIRADRKGGKRRGATDEVKKDVQVPDGRVSGTGFVCCGGLCLKIFD